MKPRQTLLEILLAALDAVNGRECTRAFLAAHPLVAPVALIALGKAACPMAQGASEALAGAIRDGFVLTKHGHAERLPWSVREAGHPLPDERSLEAGAALLEFAGAIPPAAHVLVLLSGGASALVERLPPGADLALLQRLNAWLLGSGRDIAAMNRVRKRLSLIKGGRLAQRLAPRPVTCLAISDVPDDDLRFIGSGPLVPDETAAREPVDDAPPDIRAALAAAPPLPPAADPCFARVRTEVIARLADARRAAAQAAEARGLRAHLHPERLAGDALQTGARLAQTLVAAEPGLHVWGGETTVRLPPEPGRGGRNQALALAAARVLHGRPGTWLLAAGTDGTDGPTEDAGALVDDETVARGRAAGKDPEAALARADAGSFLEASGDLIQTGPTGTNVMDLVLGLRVD